MSPRTYTALAVPVALALLAGGCGGLEPAEEVAADLELANGGFDTEDEAPMFGEEPLFTASTDVEAPYQDPLEGDDAVAELMGDPEAAVYATAIQWGQMPGDPTHAVGRDWSGTFRVNRGAILIRRVVRFEDATDAIDPRTDPLAVTFRSVTRPHNDGLRLAIVDPEPEAVEPLVLEYELADGTSHSVAMADLLLEPETITVDAASNRMVAVAMRRPAVGCAHGFLHGRWHALRPGLGRFLGRVTDADGEPVGHVRGLFGTRASGEHVFFGKYIDQDGSFQGLLRGRADEGHFGGVWKDRDGDVGSLGGLYRESLPGAETGGQFLGRWAERRCGIELDEEPAPAS